MSAGGLASADAAERLRALDALAAAGRAPSSDEMKALLDCLGDERKVVQRRAAECLRDLAAAGAAVTALLRGRLAAGPLRARWGAAYALSLIESPGPEALDTLLETLALEDGDLRWAALDLLSRAAIGNRDLVVGRLTEAAENGTAIARKMALYALSALDARERRSVAAAIRALDAAGVDLRLAGLSALASLSDDHAAAGARIARLVSDADERMRRAAAAALGRLEHCPPAALAALEEARASADASLRRAAERSLALLRKKSG